MHVHTLFPSQTIFPSNAAVVSTTAGGGQTARHLRSAAFSRVTLAAFAAFSVSAFVALTAGVPTASAQTAGSVSGTSATAVGELVAIPLGYKVSTDTDLGEYSGANMTVEVVLAPTNGSELNETLEKLYDTNSPGYHQWLGTGEFNARFAPSDAQIAAVEDYLEAHGLVVEPSSSPFLVRASGPSSTVEEAFATTLHSYRDGKGTTYFSNASEIRMPAVLAAGVLGVIGVTNTVRLEAHPRRAMNSGSTAPPAAPPFCDTPYPTTTELFAFANNGTTFPYGYGDGPQCSGLTPSQDNAIYGAPEVGLRGKGKGANLGLFELSEYQHSDIAVWTETFYGSGYKAPLVDINVDGGPLNPKCPKGDQCVPGSEGYFGDVEVDADIQMQLAVAPAANKLFVYNAPNDETGQTELDEYARIASDNIADVVSSSWAGCENDDPAAYVQAENLIFEQMALQGQSMFSAAGDTGAFSCIRNDGTTVLSVLDPGVQPWVTSVGGTSMFTFNPGANPNPSYPAGVESVWNVDNLCSAAVPSAANGQQGGFFWCANTGAGGGGSSQYWGRPIYQFGPGITNAYTTYGNGTTHCALARVGTPCREVPDVSVNADAYTGYAEYCTPAGSETYSDCAQPPIGWFGIGGTSLSSPFWSAIIADRDGFFQGRVGNANPLLYLLYNLDYQGFFHDITGSGPSTRGTVFPTNNGYFPVTRYYDMATGIGTPKMGALITGFPEY